MRVGMNPARKKVMDNQPPSVTAAVMTYIPSQLGYFEQRLDILKLCLTSLRKNTRVPLHLLALANGCCEEAVDLLQEYHRSGWIDTLIISKENLGVVGGYKLIFNAAQSDIVAYCDDDVLFYPGWLEAQLAVMEAFPRVGMVSGVPVRDGGQHAMKSLLHLEKDGLPGVKISRERIIPDEWETDWCLSTGRDPEAYLAATKDWRELVFKKDNIQVVGSANHFQFVARRKAVVEALPADWSQNLMDSLIPFEEAVDQAGWLRLSTVGRYCRHIGNLLTPELAQESRQIGLVLQVRLPSVNRKHWLLRIPGIGRILRKIYDRLFKILNEI